jgi:hypothetical protein
MVEVFIELMVIESSKFTKLLLDDTPEGSYKDWLNALLLKTLFFLPTSDNSHFYFSLKARFLT